MDPVAQQFLSQLDAATEELPKSVHAGLAMCGVDVVPGLVERVTDAERPVTTRSFAAQVLAEMKAPEGWGAMADVVAGGSVVMLPLLGRLLAAGGRGAGEAALERAEQAERPGEVRCVLAGLAVRAAGVDGAGERAARVASHAFPEAPRAALALMRMVPSPSYRQVLQDHSELLRVDPEGALEVLLAIEPEGSEAHRVVSALVGGMENAIDRVIGDVAAGLAPAAPADPSEGLRDEP